MSRKSWALAGLFWLTSSAMASTLSLQADDINGAGFHGKGITLRLDGQALSARIGELDIGAQHWSDVRLECPAVAVDGTRFQCPRATLSAGKAVIPLSFRYDGAARQAELSIFTDSRETWRLQAQQTNGRWNAVLTLANANPSRVSAWLPAEWPRATTGAVNGSIRLENGRVEARLDVRQAAFGDASGLHAGEKVSGQLSLDASRAGTGWQWRGQVVWDSGQVFWQPFYFPSGGHRLTARGSLADGRLRVDDGELQLAGVGSARLSGGWRNGGLDDFSLAASGFKLDGLYHLLLQPLLQKGSLGKLDAKGEGDLVWQYRAGATTRFDVALREASLADKDGRFAFSGLNLRVPWGSGVTGDGELGWRGGHFFKVPLGATQTRVHSENGRLTLADFSVPVLDGSLSVDGFRAERVGDAWRWRFAGGVAPVSMERLSAALGLTPMHGALSAVVPAVNYDGEAVKVDGAVLVRAFDGTLVAKDIVLRDPFGPAPRLYADVDMRNLDLDLLTRTFSFGSMTGRVDASVSGLELSAWKPVRFDARVASSPGDYPRRISQRAVENISALGGAGAAAAIQRSFLRFLKDFGYSRIGLSCKLVNGVCEMGGVESSPQGYVIVKGGGVPAITVIGYNRQVGWDELLDRLNRIRQDGMKPIVK